MMVKILNFNINRAQYKDMGKKNALYLNYYLSPSVANVKLCEGTRSTQGSLYIYCNYSTGFPANN